MGEDFICINTQPAVLAAEIAKVIQSVTPSEQNIAEVQRQLLCRHAELRLGKKTAHEEVIEGFFRCLLTDHLQRLFKIEPGEISSCINSSHTAVRGICIAGSRHIHQSITDADWKKAWRDFQGQHPEVNIPVSEGRSARRADLYLVAQGGIVSVEYKYLGSHGSLNAEGCAEQMLRYVENHAATLLFIYASSSDGKEVRGLEKLRSRLGPAVHVILVHGPAVPRVMTDIEKARRLFQEVGLAFPTLPDKFAMRLKERGNCCFSTRDIDWNNYMWPYNLHYYVQEFEQSHVEDYAVLSSSGHGINSYAIQYYLVHGSLGMFLHLGWGGCYMDANKASAKIRDCFLLADQIVLAVKNVESLGGDNRLLIVGSDFYGSYWLPPGGSRREKDAVSEGPSEVLTEVLHWLRNSP